MIYALFSDLHADEAGLAKLQRHESFRGANRRICLGDVINAHQPQGAVAYYQRVREACEDMVLGNHEAMLIGKCEAETFNAKIQSATVDARNKLAAESPEFLNELMSLPIELTIGSVLLRHASFDPQNPWQHVRYIEDAQAQEVHLPGRVHFLGHGHIPFIAWLADGLWYYQRSIYGRSFTLDANLTYIINAGSVLGSREMRHYEKSFLTYDDVGKTITFYNIEEGK